MAYMTNREFAEHEYNRQKRNAYADALVKEVRRLRAERDAAVEDMNSFARFEKERCAYCIHDNECEPGEMLCSYKGYSAFEWRGPQETGGALNE